MAEKYEVTTAIRVISWVTARLASLGIGNLVLLTTKGAKTGRPRRVTLSPIDDDHGEYLVSPYGESGWVRNARAFPTCRLRRGRDRRTVRLVEVTGDKPELVKAYYERERFARRYMDVPGKAEVEDFASVPDRFPIFRLEDT